MIRLSAAAMVLLVGLACRSEPLGDHTSYEYRDPRLREAAEWMVYPESQALPELARLMRRARTTGPPAGEFIVMETDAPIESVVAFYLGALDPGVAGESPTSSVDYETGDFATDEPRLVPLLEKLGVPFSRGVVSGPYRSAVIRTGHGGPTVSLQRPYRDFTRDALVDRTLIMVAR